MKTTSSKKGPPHRLRAQAAVRNAPAGLAIPLAVSPYSGALERSGPPLAEVLRDAALRVVGVSEGRSLAIEAMSSQAGFHALRGALLDVTHGTLRQYGRGAGIVKLLSGRPAGQPVEALLWCAVYALDSGRYAAYTVVDQAVRACAMLGCQGASGYVNGLLRTYLRQKVDIETQLEGNPEAKWQHPAWWIEIVRAAYPESWREILLSGNSRPPMCLRVNLRKNTLVQYRARLAEQGMPARQLGNAGLVLETPVAVEKLPGFAAGDVSVQDAGAQIAAVLLDLQDGQRVLDACAAPGGKTGHIAESANVTVTALDVDPDRCLRIGQNMTRLGLAASIVVGDAAKPDKWWDGIAYDRVLVDMACSSSGVVRRRPDIKWLRRHQDIAAYAAKQAGVLQALWPVLAPSGKLLYATCSVFPAENERVIENFLERTSSARRLEPTGGAAQLSPNSDHDGFFYALLEKRA